MSQMFLPLTLTGIEQTALDFLKYCKKYNKFAFYGAMGAGKTTFITALCKVLKSTDLVSSPTFAIINEYSTEAGESIYHFDFYRIKSIEELYDIGFEEYCRPEAWCFVEWPEKAEEVIPDDFLPVRIIVDNAGHHNIYFEV